MLTNESLQPQCLPRIPIKTPIKIHLTGLLRADDESEAKHFVYGVRLDPTGYENDGNLNLYPDGWEYAVGRIMLTAQGQESFWLYGWFPESELMAKGYGLEADAFTESEAA